MFLWIPETFNRIAQYKDNYPNQPGTFCNAVENFKLIKNSIHNKNTVKTNMEAQHYNSSDVIDYSDEFENKTNLLDMCNDSINFSVYTNSALLGLLTGLGIIGIILLMKIFSRKHVLGKL